MTAYTAAMNDLERALVRLGKLRDKDVGMISVKFGPGDGAGRFVGSRRPGEAHVVVDFTAEGSE